jgi:histidine triad (HIT) family protein
VRDPDCIFCKVIAGEIPGEIVDSDDRTITVMDINPATRGHVVVIPREHAENLVSVSEEDLAATMNAARRMVERLQE